MDRTTKPFTSQECSIQLAKTLCWCTWTLTLSTRRSQECVLLIGSTLCKGPSEPLEITGYCHSSSWKSITVLMWGRCVCRRFALRLRSASICGIKLPTTDSRAALSVWGKWMNLAFSLSSTSGKTQHNYSLRFSFWNKKRLFQLHLPASLCSSQGSELIAKKTENKKWSKMRQLSPSKT